MALTAATLYLRSLPRDNAGAGFLGFLDFMGESLNPHGHSKGRFQSWWTHFVLLLEYSDGSVWKLERASHGVVFEKLSMDQAHHLGHPTFVWKGNILGERVQEFVNEQRQYSYDFVGKNCQHFAYDFFRCCLDDHRAHGHFETFTESCQELYRMK